MDVEESEKGVFDGLAESGLVAGLDFQYSVRNAQGNMATVSSLVDAALVEGADMLVTFSTPTLQPAIQRAGQTPVVFTYVANAIAAGAGSSDTDHLPNVTGVYMMSAVEPMLDAIRELLWRGHCRTTSMMARWKHACFAARRQPRTALCRSGTIDGMNAVSPPVRRRAG